MMTEKKKVLVVDDDVDFLTQQRIMLEAVGYDVVTAESLAEAEGLLENMEPDAAILDLMMEHHDAGFVLCYHLKKKNPAIPVIICTAVQSETAMDFDATTEEEQSWVKADLLLAKPVRFEQLKLELERLLKEN